MGLRTPGSIDLVYWIDQQKILHVGVNFQGWG
jgi:hypothetical protein